MKHMQPRVQPATSRVDGVDYAGGPADLRARARNRVRAGTGRAAGAGMGRARPAVPPRHRPRRRRPADRHRPADARTQDRPHGGAARLARPRRRRRAAAGPDRRGPRRWAGTRSSLQCAGVGDRLLSRATASCPTASASSKPASTTSRCARAARTPQRRSRPAMPRIAACWVSSAPHAATCGSTAASSIRACSTSPRCSPPCAASPPQPAARVHILLQDAAAPQRAHGPADRPGATPAQRVRCSARSRSRSTAPTRPPSSPTIAGGYYFRPLGHRFEGESRPARPGPGAAAAATVRAGLGAARALHASYRRAGHLSRGAATAPRSSTPRPGTSRVSRRRSRRLRL